MKSLSQTSMPYPGERHLAAIRARERTVSAWVHLDDAAVQGAGPFMGVKDVIDVRGMPTRAGSRARQNIFPAAADATIVRRLREAGFVPLGKTVTTEFAFVDPAATRNPYALTHSPGGSSSGSAAAVAAGMVPLALGTQTAGSLCRPAAYCGVAAIKPSFGLLPTDGVVPLSPSFDTPGVMARDVARAAEALAIMARQSDLADAALPRYVRIACLPDRFGAASSDDVRDFHARTIDTLRQAGFAMVEVGLSANFARMIDDHRTVMLWEAHAAHGALLQTYAELLQPRFREGLAYGSTLTSAAVSAAHTRLAAARAEVWDTLGGYDAVLLQPAPQPAPSGFTTTGDQSYQTPWTACHGPMITVPGELNADGLPLGSMLVAAPGSDRRLIAIAKAAQAAIDRLPRIAPDQPPRRSVR